METRCHFGEWTQTRGFLEHHSCGHTGWVLSVLALTLPILPPCPPLPLPTAAMAPTSNWHLSPGCGMAHVREINTPNLRPSVGQIRGTVCTHFEGVHGGDLLPLGFLPSGLPHHLPSPQFVLLGLSPQTNYLHPHPMSSRALRETQTKTHSWSVKSHNPWESLQVRKLGAQEDSSLSHFQGFIARSV